MKNYAWQKSAHESNRTKWLVLLLLLFHLHKESRLVYKNSLHTHSSCKKWSSIQFEMANLYVLCALFVILCGVTNMMEIPKHISIMSITVTLADGRENERNFRCSCGTWQYDVLNNNWLSNPIQFDLLTFCKWKLKFSTRPFGSPVCLCALDYHVLCSLYLPPTMHPILISTIRFFSFRSFCIFYIQRRK